jgi:hypothetical protein
MRASTSTFGVCSALGLALLAPCVVPVASADDVTRPAEVAGLVGERDGTSALFSWPAVVVDVLGGEESVAQYNVYRGAAPDFVPDKEFGSNRVATVNVPSHEDVEVLAPGETRFYLVSAVDTAGNEGATRASKVTGAPTLFGEWRQESIELLWTGASPGDEVAAYRVYYGQDSASYEAVDDVGASTFHALTGLIADTNYYIAVTAVDFEGNESPFSNQHIDALAGTVVEEGWTMAHHCFGTCPPVGDQVQRDSGREIVVPFEFPEGDWVRIELTYTVYSNALLDTGCVWPDGGGDIFDRAATVFLVEDETCLDEGRCFGRQGNLELLRVVTPFGTNDATGPRTWTFDVTPFASLLRGTKWLGSNITTWDPNGWYSDVSIRFVKDPAQASPKAPAHGVVPVFYHDGGQIADTVSVTVPPTAQKVWVRLFTTGHGAEPPSNCDEFCQKTNRILVDGQEVWAEIPWRTDCSPAGNSCSNWNACGFPSCTFPRSGWCPGYVACHHNDPCDQDLDLSDALAPGGTHDVGFEVMDMTPGAIWTKSLVVYWYE